MIKDENERETVATDVEREEVPKGTKLQLVRETIGVLRVRSALRAGGGGHGACKPSITTMPWGQGE
jgi:hypothetical protein